MENTSATSSSGGPTFRLIYRSHNRIAQSNRKVELGNIFSTARSKNKKRGVTGALLTYEDWFVQALEGEEGVVRSVFDHIERDGRHDHISLLTAEDVDGRVFSRWSMAKVSEDGEPDIPLITNVNKGGISPAAGHPTTVDQEGVLEFMRSALRGDINAV